MDHLIIWWGSTLDDTSCLEIKCCFLLSVCKCCTHFHAGAEKWLKRLRRDSNWIKKNVYVLLMPTIWIEQFYNRWVKILFYLVSFEKKKKKKKTNVKQIVWFYYCTRICFRLGPFEINVKFVITIVSL